MKRLIFLFSVLLMLFSCRTYKISQSDLRWQPYRKGDVLIFESNKGEIDTIDVENVEVYTNPDDPLAVFPNKLQSLFVLSQKSILEMSANKGGTSIHFTIRLGNNHLKYPSTVVGVKELESIKMEKGRYVIEAKEYYDNMKDVPFDLRYIYWSKEYGYLELEFKENYIWTLKSFIRDGKEIL